MPTMFDTDHLPYLMYFLGGLGVALTFGAYLSARNRNRLPIERLTLLLCPVVAFITLTFAAIKVVQTPGNDWEANRLTPSIALLSGAKLYIGPNGAGELMNTTFPPVAYLAYVPAGLFTKVTAVIIAGSCLSLVYYLAPALVLNFWSRRSRSGGRPLLMSVVSLLVLFQLTLSSESLAHAAFSIHADAPMLAFAGLAAMILYLRRDDPSLSIATCLFSTVCASMAVWSELSAATMVLILPIWVFATRGFREGLRYSFFLLMALATFTFLFRMVFGVGSFTFSILELPRKHAWIFDGPAFRDGLIMFSTEFLCGAAGFVASLILAVILRWNFTPAEAADSGEKASGLRSYLIQNSWVLFVLMGFASVPTSLLNRITLGGYLNNYSPTFYFLMLGLIAFLLEWHAANHVRRLESFNALLMLGLLLLVLSPQTCSEESFRVLGTLHRPSINVQEVAYRFSQRHPGRAYFPWNPLSNLLGEGKLYDFDSALLDRETTGYPVTKLHVRQHLPESLRLVCYPPYMKGMGPQFEQTMKYLPEFGRQVEIPELAGWTCYERTWK